MVLAIDSTTVSKKIVLGQDPSLPHKLRAALPSPSPFLFHSLSQSVKYVPREVSAFMGPLEQRVLYCRAHNAF
ncbi:hypothetical protein CEXT_376841 [Caerostris extrusa]|uniref:Uncharacterized protein n=1 Tax=Caerostris extrusa TaxID=172846 RepID=A0AAV4MKI6_CAEEX|nr:hypothetical protein CEXT_376841 [Caerostris extrusa]